jgi:hypothetical protein
VRWLTLFYRSGLDFDDPDDGSDGGAATLKSESKSEIKVNWPVSFSTAELNADWGPRATTFRLSFFNEGGK